MNEFEKMNIQWYPGHMTKTRRQIEADLKQVDAVCEIVDARIPVSSRNPDIDSICGNKPRIIVLNRMDLADPTATKKWMTHFKNKGITAIATDCKTRRGIADFTPAARSACAEKLQRDAARGMNRPLRV
ncbi:MAG: ribosome biogenesis GTPase YlqF, partial [Lachnospiraceae bacterium]|nr:ribosome biogenesis GTPase YlqF [Lachnospiraceae bacterium]